MYACKDKYPSIDVARKIYIESVHNQSSGSKLITSKEDGAWLLTMGICFCLHSREQNGEVCKQ